MMQPWGKSLCSWNELQGFQGNALKHTATYDAMSEHFPVRSPMVNSKRLIRTSDRIPWMGHAITLIAVGAGLSFIAALLYSVYDGWIFRGGVVLVSIFVFFRYAALIIHVVKCHLELRKLREEFSRCADPIEVETVDEMTSLQDLNGIFYFGRKPRYYEGEAGKLYCAYWVGATPEDTAMARLIV